MADACSPMRNLGTIKKNADKIKGIKQWFLVAEDDPTEFIRQNEAYAQVSTKSVRNNTWKF